MKSLAELVFDDKAEEYRRVLINEQKEFFDKMMREQNAPRIIKGGGRKNYFIMVRDRVVARELTKTEAEAFVKLMD